MKDEQECYKKDDLFARDNDGWGYFQCQVHLRDKNSCNRPINPIVKALKKHIKTFTNK